MKVKLVRNPVDNRYQALLENGNIAYQTSYEVLPIRYLTMAKGFGWVPETNNRETWIEAVMFLSKNIGLEVEYTEQFFKMRANGYRGLRQETKDGEEQEVFNNSYRVVRKGNKAGRKKKEAV